MSLKNDRCNVCLLQLQILWRVQEINFRDTETRASGCKILMTKPQLKPLLRIQSASVFVKFVGKLNSTLPAAAPTNELEAAPFAL